MVDVNNDACYVPPDEKTMTDEEFEREFTERWHDIDTVRDIIFDVFDDELLELFQCRSLTFGLLLSARVKKRIRLEINDCDSL